MVGSRAVLRLEGKRGVIPVVGDTWGDVEERIGRLDKGGKNIAPLARTREGRKSTVVDRLCLRASDSIAA